MSFSIELYDGDVEISGWAGLRSRKAAEKHLPDLLNDAQRHSRPRSGELDIYRIAITEHAADCPGGCPDELGLAPGCRTIAEFPASEA